jgi:hypothetical protein
MLPGVSTHDLGRRLGAIVTAKLNGVDSAQAAAALGEKHINVSTTVPEHNQFDTEQRGVHPLIPYETTLGTTSETALAPELLATSESVFPGWISRMISRARSAHHVELVRQVVAGPETRLATPQRSGTTTPRRSRFHATYLPSLTDR